jgi:KUP system potassium uptake protein
MLVGIVKTAIIALHFRSAAGEGGPIALYHSLFPQKQTVVPQTWLQPIIVVSALFAASLTIADGVLGPSVSVISAVGGIAVKAQDLRTQDIKGIAVAVLAIFYSVQFFGVVRLSHYFMPIISLWLLLLLSIGIYNITLFPTIFRAFDPSRCILWFVRNHSISQLSGVLLCITGVESLYASISLFDVSAIRLGFIGFAFPSLALSYLGQGAHLMRHPEDINNVFFRSIPATKGNGLFWVVWVISILAAVMASQGMCVCCAWYSER